MIIFNKDTRSGIVKPSKINFDLDTVDTYFKNMELEIIEEEVDSLLERLHQEWVPGQSQKVLEEKLEKNIKF